MRALTTAAQQLAVPAASPPDTVAVEPTDDEWLTASSEYFHRVRTVLSATVARQHAKLDVTLCWLRAWGRLPLTDLERAAIVAAATRLDSGEIHPAMGLEQLRRQPVGAWIMRPAPGVAITWRTSPETGHPVFLTLSVPSPGY